MNKNIRFKRTILRFDEKIKYLADKIIEEQNIMAKSLLIALKNDLILEKNKAIEAFFSANRQWNVFRWTNKENIAFNENVFVKNLRIRENNPYFYFLESKLSSECLTILLESAREEKMTEVLHSLEEFI